MKVLDLFSGLRGWSDPWALRGHDVFAVDHEERFAPDLVADVAHLDRSDLPWLPDVLLASPPCETFSALARDRNYDADGHPKNERAAAALFLVIRTALFVDELAAEARARRRPFYFVFENPVGKLGVLRSGLERHERVTVTYCQYGAPWRKPTHLWGGFPPSWTPRPTCRPRARCHSPGTGGRGIQANARSGKNVTDPESKYLEMAMADGKGSPDNPRLSIYKARARAAAGTSDPIMLAAIRAKIPEALSTDLCIAAERDLELRRPPTSRTLFP